MNWEAISAIGELVAAAAVLVTLVYLAAQIKQNTQSVTTATYETALNGFNELNRFVAQDSELASIVRRGAADPTSLNEEEAFRYQFVNRNYTNHMYKLLRLYERGIYPRAEWEGSLAEAAQLFALPGLASFRKENHFYQDLWQAIDQVEVTNVTDLKLGEAPQE